MKNILVPLGGSNLGETLQYAVDFATEFSSEIYVMEVFNASLTAGNLRNVVDKVVESSKDRVKELIDKADSKNVPIKMVTFNGDLIDGIKGIDKELEIDLIIISARSNSIEDAVYLGNTTGSIVKQTNISTLVVPKGTVYKPFKTILTAFKSGVLKKKKILKPLIAIKQHFNSAVSLLLVKTPGYDKDDLKVHPALMDISEQLTLTENATTYQGVLENFQAKHPDLLCVFRRKRGFFKKLWEKNTILKSEFFVKIPVLILGVNDK